MAIGIASDFRNCIICPLLNLLSSEQLEKPLIKGKTMALRLGDEAPNFTAETTEGKIEFHSWLGNGWGILFSHPKDFTPVCTTELGTVAKMKAEFDKRNVKVIAISVDPIESHHGWICDINETQ